MTSDPKSDSTDEIVNFVGGRTQRSVTDEFTQLIDPTTGEANGRTPVTGPAEVDAAVRSAADAFETWRRVTPGERQRLLLELADSVLAHSDELVALQARDTGQLKRYIASEEVEQGADQLRFFAGAARLLNGAATAEYLEGHTSSIRREPIGVIAQVAPWNYPFGMAAWKIAPALAAGNTIVLKPSETTPRSTVLLAQLAGEILPPGVFNLVNGDARTGRCLVEHEIPAMVAITGSVRAGIEVARSAASRLARTHLELGGKAPAVVFGDSDVKSAAEGIASAAFFNAGQDCTAATRAIVHRTVLDDFTEALVSEAQSHRPGAPDDTSAALGPLQNRQHFDKVANFVSTLPEHASVLTGGAQVGDRGFYFAPTVICNVSQDDAIVQQEVFGPIVTIQPFDDEAEAVRLANGVPYGIAASAWTSDHGTATRISGDLDFGCVWINDHLPFVSEMPHGGFGISGYGKDLSVYGFEDYTRVKHVMSAHR
ncbi:gamma-aminobutyraldehyde dehydrogenase [Mycobacterium sp. 21AC1]|uniref:gamma-aminobutyraldehyde dehydrogenase n=1 Tax=[Mycobacterium] appelbergii TaxID=2939269 RepID=UPI0029391326|nr:gamma-aminobutyraldehyde dehydrogenase [Mycobacterium sp. 21AC1]MDV3128427.1 gamma-aminobutyraldehyde dehydrogenase [Mycobacterium sp. 21AC1]